MLFLCNSQHDTLAIISTWSRGGIQVQNLCQNLPFRLGWDGLVMFPSFDLPHGKTPFNRHFWLRKVGFDAFQEQMVA